MDDSERGPERRQAPRREADRRLHYAREALLAAALAYVDDEPRFRDGDGLERAAQGYRAAEAGVFQESLDL